MDLVVVQHGGDPVRADEEAVADLTLDREQVGLGRAALLQGPHEHRPARMVRGLVDREPALVDQALHEGVVVGDLVELAVAEQVGTGVADVTHPHPRAVDQQRDQRRARTAQGGIGVGDVREPVRGGVHRGAERAEQIDVVQIDAVERGVDLGDGIDRHCARDLAVGVPAHSVGDGDESRAGVCGVLVHGAAAPDVGSGRRAHRRSHGSTFSTTVRPPRSGTGVSPERVRSVTCRDVLRCPGR